MNSVSVGTFTRRQMKSKSDPRQRFCKSVLREKSRKRLALEGLREPSSMSLKVWKAQGILVPEVTPTGWNTYDDDDVEIVVAEVRKRAVNWPLVWRAK